MSKKMKRRDFLGAAVGVAAAVPLLAHCSTTSGPVDGDAGADGGRGDGSIAGDGSTVVDGSTAGDGAVVAGATDWDALYASALGTIPATAKWVATDGSDSNAGTEAKPYLTIGKAIANIAAGGQVIIKDGVYTGAANWINDVSATIPNGISDAQRTIIRAQNRLKVRITQTARPSGYYESIVYLKPGSTFIWIDGLVAETTWQAATGDDNASATISDEGNANRVTRVIVKKSSCSRYGGSFQYGNGAVFEDCHSFGSGRYQFFGGTGGGSVPAGSAVLRRCSSYMPFGPVLEPTASFCFYGSNDGAYAECKNVLFANCYELDSPHLTKTADPDARKWGSFYMPKSVRNLSFIGCGSLNDGAEYGGFRTDNFGGAGDLLATYRDCFVWNLKNGSPASAEGFGKASNGQIVVDHCTAGQLQGTSYVTSEGSTVTNSNLGGTVAHLPLREAGKGAEQLYAVGSFLSAYGQPGFDQPQPSLRLWPFPYEAEVAAVCAETLTKVGTDAPTSVTQSTSPYATTAAGGGKHTLTTRIWEAAGTPMPPYATIYP